MTRVVVVTVGVSFGIATIATAQGMATVLYCSVA